LSSKITELYQKWGHRSFIFTLICIVWLAWRVGTKPTRISYPCSQFALWQILIFFSPTTIPVTGILYKSVRYVRNREYQKIAGIALAILLMISSFNLYNSIKDNQLRIAGSGTIPKASPEASPSVIRTGSEADAQSIGFPSTIVVDESVVSFSYNPSISYGGSSPYDPQDNPAYDFVWETVERLGLGSPSSPLERLIEPGDTVLIELNLVDFGPEVYTRPEVVRPLIDMAIGAGATEIYVGDGGTNVPQTNSVMDNAGYSDMVSELDSRHPGITIETVNLNALSNGWHWVSLDTDSSFAGSGHSQYDLAAADGAMLFGHQYYSTPDPQGVNPEGDVLGWYAISDKVLDADVIINVSKMKTHQKMMATMSIKNLVGCTISSTYNENSGNTQSRIPHQKTDMEENYFNNDIFWRAILDMNKILLYADEDGVLQPEHRQQS
jgi:uncharacterized protein (DUF362 family)